MENVTRNDKPKWYKTLRGKAIIFVCAVLFFLLGLSFAIYQLTLNVFESAILGFFAIPFLVIFLFIIVIYLLDYKEADQEGRKKMINEAVEFLTTSPSFFYGTAAFLLLFLLIIIDLIAGFGKEDFMGVLVEAHGMLMDIIVLGILFSVYLHLKERKDKSKDCHENIDLLKDWHTQDGMQNLIVCIKKLNLERVREFYLV
jgi:hypothetical protein